MNYFGWKLCCSKFGMGSSFSKRLSVFRVCGRSHQYQLPCKSCLPLPSWLESWHYLLLPLPINILCGTCSASSSLHLSFIGVFHDTLYFCIWEVASQSQGHRDIMPQGHRGVINSYLQLQSNMFIIAMMHPTNSSKHFCS